MHDKQSETHFRGIEGDVIILTLSKNQIPSSFATLLFNDHSKKNHTAYAFIVFIIGSVLNSRALWNIAVSLENRQDM